MRRVHNESELPLSMALADAPQGHVRNDLTCLAQHDRGADPIALAGDCDGVDLAHERHAHLIE
jgi:hypothetical protein